MEFGKRVKGVFMITTMRDQVTYPSQLQIILLPRHSISDGFIAQPYSRFPLKSSHANS